MPSIHPLTRRLQFAGVAIVVALTALVWVILEIGSDWPKAALVGGFAAAALISVSLVERWFMRMIIGPLTATEQVAVRLAKGDLRVTEAEIQAVGGGPLTESIRSISGIFFIAAITSFSRFGSTEMPA